MVCCDARRRHYGMVQRLNLELHQLPEEEVRRGWVRIHENQRRGIRAGESRSFWAGYNAAAWALMSLFSRVRSIGNKKAPQKKGANRGREVTRICKCRRLLPMRQGEVPA